MLHCFSVVIREYTLKHKVIKQSTQTTALHQAVLNGELLSVRELMGEADTFNQQLHFVDYNNNLPLDRACPRGHFEIVELLVNAHKKPGNEYVMHNPQNYYPFLSTVRWYLKVLDNAKNQLNVGVFNRSENFSEDYVKIIRLLAKEYSETVGNCDNKGLNALDYAIIHLSHAMGKKKLSSEKIVKIEALIEMLMDFNLSYNVHRQMPHIWAKVGASIIQMEQDKKIEKQRAHSNNVTSAIAPLKTEKAVIAPKDIVLSSENNTFFNQSEKSTNELVYDYYVKILGMS